MKRILIILGITLLVLFLGVLAFVLLQPKPTTPPVDVPVTFPGSGGVSGGGASFAIPSDSGEPIEVQDFIHNGETVEDPANTGNYYLAGSTGYCSEAGECAAGAATDTFTVVYFSGEQTFVIGLTKEPLGEARRAAEVFLRDRLGITEQSMCALKYYLTTDYEVSEQYAGLDLRFSFCDGAIPLP